MISETILKIRVSSRSRGIGQILPFILLGSR